MSISCYLGIRLPFSMHLSGAALIVLAFVLGWWYAGRRDKAMSALPPDLDPVVRAEAWIGDAVLALYVREWILEMNHGVMNGELFMALTSNQFLRLVGNATAVEAEIGKAYRAEGLAGGYEWIQLHLREKMEQRLHSYRKQEQKKR